MEDRLLTLVKIINWDHLRNSIQIISQHSSVELDSWCSKISWISTPENVGEKPKHEWKLLSVDVDDSVVNSRDVGVSIFSIFFKGSCRDESEREWGILLQRNRVLIQTS